MIWGPGCWCGSGKNWRRCHYPVCDPHLTPEEICALYKRTWQIRVKLPRQIPGIRKASKIASQILEELTLAAKEGVSLADLDKFSKELHKKWDVRPAPLGYGSPPYPATICTSPNSVICHGLPDQTVLKKGDILNIDVTAIWKGHFGDCSRMVCIEPISEARKKLVRVTLEALCLGIQQVKPGGMVSDIGNAIGPYAESHGYSVVDSFVGHGIGLKFHEAPNIFHQTNSINIPFVAGMVFTIEPMLNIGTKEGITDPHNGWTVTTADNQDSAQWEHTILVTETGYEILTELYPYIAP